MEASCGDGGVVGHEGPVDGTWTFEAAVAEIERKGGGRLDVGAGVWVTIPFNLTIHMTLFLKENTVILGGKDEKKWPLLAPLPSYGQGREHACPRHGSLIHGQNLEDVVITVFPSRCETHGDRDGSRRILASGGDGSTVGQEGLVDEAEAAFTDDVRGGEVGSHGGSDEVDWVLAHVARLVDVVASSSEKEDRRSIGRHVEC